MPAHPDVPLKDLDGGRMTGSRGSPAEPALSLSNGDGTMRSTAGSGLVGRQDRKVPQARLNRLPLCSTPQPLEPQQSRRDGTTWSPARECRVG